MCAIEPVIVAPSMNELLIAVLLFLDPVYIRWTQSSGSAAKRNSDRLKFFRPWLRLSFLLGYQTQPPAVSQPNLWHRTDRKPGRIGSGRELQLTDAVLTSGSNSSSKPPDVRYSNRVIGVGPTGIAELNGPTQVAQLGAPQAPVCIDVNSYAFS